MGPREKEAAAAKAKAEQDAREKAEAEAKAKAEADAREKAEAEAGAKAEAAAKTSSPAGPICKQEVRHRGKTYAVGDRLPTNLTKADLDRLTEIGWI